MAHVRSDEQGDEHDTSTMLRSPSCHPLEDRAARRGGRVSDGNAEEWCKECEGEGVVHQQVDVDRTRAIPCPECSQASWEGDFDRYYDDA